MIKKDSSLEKIVNHAIENGAAIADAACPLGTILPTAASLRAGDRAAARNASLDARFAAADPLLSKCACREASGETRYYLDESRYATVRNQRARWFEVRADGDYSIPAPPASAPRATVHKSADRTFPKFAVVCIAGPTRWFDTQDEADRIAANLNSI